MDWFMQLFSALGIPEVAIATASALYAGSLVAEQKIRPEALRELFQYMSRSTTAEQQNGALALKSIFDATFGTRQLSSICIGRSITAAVYIILAASVIYYLNHLFVLPGLFDLLFVVAISFLGSFFSVWKTRVLLYVLSVSRLVSSPVMILIDFVAAYLISFVTATAATIYVALMNVPGYPDGWISSTIPLIIRGDANTYFFNPLPLVVLATKFFRDIPDGFLPFSTDYFPITFVCLMVPFSITVWTLLTSLGLLGATVFRPLRAVVAWCLPTDQHPVQAIGIAGAVIVLFVAFSFHILALLSK